MKFQTAFARPLGLCIGIVTTCVLAWWLAGPENTSVPRPPQAAQSLSKVSRPLPVQPPRPGEGQPKWDELALTPPVQIEMNLFQERLLKDATLLDRRQFEARGSEPAREVKLWRTGFKYPLVREEVWLRADEQGRKLPVHREFSVADHVMIQFPTRAAPEQISAWTAKHRLHVRLALRTAPVYLVAAADGSLNTADAIMGAFKKDFPDAPAQMGTAERDYLVFPSLIPNDTSFSQLWGMHNTGQSGGTVDADIDAPEAWDITTGSRNVLVGVIDTGVDRNHPDLAANMWTNPHETAGNGLDDDGNGFVDDVHGWDFFADDNDPMDEEGHGTHCSGTIGGVGNNLTGVAGVCWQVSIVGLRFLGPAGGSTSDAIESVNYANNLGVSLTSNSWGGGGFSSLLQTAIANAGAAGQLFIAAAGNDGSNTDLIANYPSGYAVNTIIAVASSTASDTRSSFSNYGATTVDLAAPGSLIYSTIPGSSYATYSGTSMATPHVAGAVALLKSVAPAMSASEIKTRLLETVDPVSALSSTSLSRGRLNVARLIEQSAGPYPVVTVTTIEEDGGNGDGINNPGEALALRFTVANRGNEAAQNLIATLSSRAASSKFTITQGTVALGTLAPDQTLASSTPFRVQSQANLSTPYAEEFAITLSHGSPVQTTEYRVSLYLHTSARLEGQVTDASTQAPLAGANIRVTGTASFNTTTDQDGRYAVVVTNGVYQITASATGYVTSAPIQLSAPPGRSGLNFALGIPQLGLNPPILSETIYSGRTSTRLVEMRNRGSAALTWSLELVNGQTSSSAAAELPAIEIPTHRETPDTGPGASFKSHDMLLLPAVNAPMGSLTGARIGVVNTTWDRGVFISDLQARGATVVAISLPLTGAQLSDLDALIVDDMIASLSSGEVALLRDRINAGMGLLSEGDNSTSITRINQVFADTGIVASSKPGFTDITFTDIRPHPMTIGVSSLREVAVGAQASVSNGAQILVGDSGLAHAAVSKLGAGRVVFIGNEITDSSNYAAGDARRFANQIVDGMVSRPEWLTTNISSGVIQPGMVTPLIFRFEPKDLPAGAYQGTAIFTTNVPDNPETILPITMSLVDAPQISVDPTQVSFGSVVQGVSVQRPVRIKNLGRGPLLVGSMSITGTDAVFFSTASAGSFSVAAGGFVDVQTELSLNAPLRNLSAQLVINSDDPLQPTLQIPLSGARQLPPDVASSPAAISLQLKQGQTGAGKITLQNKGAGPLVWQAALGYRPDQTGTPPTWANLPGVSGAFIAKAKGQIAVNFDTGVLPPGDYTTTLYIITNDVDTPEITVPVTLKVLASPRPVFARTAGFPTTIIGQFSRQFVSVQNTGAAPFQFSTPLVMGTSFRWISKMPFIVQPGETRQLELEFRPLRPGPITTRISFVGNIPERLLYITCSGTGIVGGKLAVTPASMAVSSAPGPQQTRSFKLANTGQLPVIWSAAIEGAGAEAFTLEEPFSGTVMTGSSTLLNVTMKTVNTAAATYRAKLVISNDTGKPRIEVPLTLTIRRGAFLEVLPAPLMLTKVWTDSVRDSTLVLMNKGNIPLKILSVVPSHTRLSLPNPLTLPTTMEAGTMLPIPVRVSSSASGNFEDHVHITTNIAAQKTVKAKVVSEVLLPPVLDVSPPSLDITLGPGETATREFSISNTGGDTLNWSAILRDVLGPAGNLPMVRANLESNQSGLTAILPSAHALTEGVSGSNIVDGGSNMFVTGNILTTDLGGGATLPYSESGITSPAGVGTGGACFTRKHGPLWVFTADLDGASRFIINGGLGAGGAGSASGGATTRTIAGVTYRGFFKRVSGATVPSVNHLIIVEDRPGLAHQFDTDTGSDFHMVTGLSGTTRLYYLLFGLRNGAVYADSTFGLLMDTFLRRVVHASSQTWLTPATATGATAPGETTEHTVQFGASQIPPGIYTAALRFLSNAANRHQVDVPMTLRIPAEARLATTPGALNFPDTMLGSSVSLSCTLSNPGNMPLTITALSVPDPAYEISGLALPATLQPGQSAAASIRFTPTEARTYPSKLAISSNDMAGAVKDVPIQARGVRGAAIQLQPDSISITVDPGVTSTQSLTLANQGDATLVWSASSAGGVSSLLSLSSTAGSVPMNETRPLTLQIVTQATTAAGTYTGYVRFGSNDPITPFLDVPVTVIIPARPRLAVLPSAVDFGQVFAGGSSSLSVQLRNSGNAPLTISDATSTSANFDAPALSLPLTLGAGGSALASVRFRPDASTVFSGQLRFTASESAPPEAMLDVTGTGIPPPTISVQPGQLSASLQRGASQSLPLTITNNGGATLVWQTQVINTSTSTGTLQDVLTRFNNAHTGLVSRIPDLYLFTEGVTGNSILDGGGDMYDNGNRLNTSLGALISYSDNLVTSSAKLGSGGSYFTRKLPGLFVFVADMNDVSSFFIDGNLGADGFGTASGSVLTRNQGGISYTGFLKSVSGTTDPSVNHLIIVESKPGINHSFSSNTDEDNHGVSGLSGSTRLYYLLFARADGLAVNNLIADAVMDEFLQNVAMPAAPPWVTTSPLAGSTTAGVSSTANVNINSSSLAEGTHTATVRVTSNAVVGSTVDVPLTLTVTPPVLAVSPPSLQTMLLTDGRSTTRTITLTALQGTAASWTATSTLPWVTLSKTSGVGSDAIDLTFLNPPSSGNYAGAVNITYDGITISVPINVTVRDDIFTKLLTDYRQPGRMLGLIQSVSGLPALLVAVDATTLAVQKTLPLPQVICDMDIATDGRRLYAMSSDARSITEVDLDTFSISRTQSLPADVILSANSQIEAGRTNRLYYTDALNLSSLHVYDFADGVDLSTYLISGTTGIDAFETSPDSNVIYARSKGGSNGAATYLARLNSGSDILSQTHTGASVLTQAAASAPIFFSANRDAVFTQNASFSPLLDSTTPYPSLNIIAASAYGHALVSDSRILSSTTGATLHTLPVSVSVSAFTGAQDALIYYNNSSQQLVRLPLSGIITLPPAGIMPQIADGAVLQTAPSRLDWTGSPLAAGYDVFLGTDAGTVAAATNGGGGIYRGNTGGVSFSISSSQFLAGQVYYWRIDIRNHDGSTVAGPVWSFRMPVAFSTPESLNVQSAPGADAVTTSFTITAANAATAWTLSENVSWLSLSSPSGTGTQTVTATLDPGALSAGTHSTQITLSSGADTVQIPVTFRLLGMLNITKMVADPSLQRVYALHRDTSSGEGWLLWIDPAAPRITHALLAGTNIVDFTVHAMDDRLYALADNGTKVISIDRQTTRQIIGSWNAPSSAAIHNGPVGRVVLRRTNNALQMHHSVTGGSVGSSVSLPATCLTCTPASGTFILVATQQSSNVTGFSRYTLSTGAITHSATQNWAGTFSSPFVLSGDGSRAFYLNRAYDVSSLSELSVLGSSIQASSWNGQVGWSNTQAIASVNAAVLGTLPFTTTIMAATADHSRLVLYNPTTRALTSVDPGSTMTNPATLGFGVIQANQPTSRSFSLYNFTSQDLTFTATSNNAGFTVTAAPITVNAGLSAQVDVTATLAANATQNGSISLVCNQAPWSRSVSVSATTIQAQASVTVGFEMSAPAAGVQLGASSYTEGGFTFAGGMLRIGMNHVNRPDNGSAHVAFTNSNKFTSIMRQGGGTFSLKAVDLAVYSALASKSSVIWEATTRSGQTVTTSFSLDERMGSAGSGTDFQTFTFPATFTDLVSARTTTDVFALDNLVFELPVEDASFVTTVTASSAGSPSGLDINADGSPDILMEPGASENTTEGMTTHRFSGTIKPGFALSKLGVQASSDSSTWSDLTPELDFTLETSPTDAATGLTPFRLIIPAVSAPEWSFRFMAR